MHFRGLKTRYKEYARAIAEELQCKIKRNLNELKKPLDYT